MIIHSNGSKWAGESPDTLEDLLRVIETETLDPSFERCGNFVYEESGTWSVFGNFLTGSHVFHLTGARKELEPLRMAIRAAQDRPEYRHARRGMKLPRTQSRGSTVRRNP